MREIKNFCNALIRFDKKLVKHLDLAQLADGRFPFLWEGTITERKLDDFEQLTVRALLAGAQALFAEIGLDNVWLPKPDFHFHFSDHKSFQEKMDLEYKDGDHTWRHITVLSRDQYSEPERFVFVLAHELAHAVSFLQADIKQTDINDRGYPIVHYNTTRLGFLFETGKEKRFELLNEGATEWLAWQILLQCRKSGELSNYLNNIAYPESFLSRGYYPVYCWLNSLVKSAKQKRQLIIDYVTGTDVFLKSKFSDDNLTVLTPLRYQDFELFVELLPQLGWSKKRVVNFRARYHY